MNNLIADQLRVELWQTAMINIHTSVSHHQALNYAYEIQSVLPINMVDKLHNEINRIYER